MSISLSGISQGLAQSAQTMSNGIASAASIVAAGANAAGSTGTQAVHGGGHHHGGGKLFQQIQQSVLSALQSQSQTPSTVSSNQTVQSAIGQVLQGRFSSANGATSETANSEPGDTDVDSNSVQQFFQKLQGYGVSPEQFRGDFLNAMQQQGGQAGAGGQTAVPLGLLVNLLA
jgi:hypothetical protein